MTAKRPRWTRPQTAGLVVLLAWLFVAIAALCYPVSTAPVGSRGGLYVGVHGLLTVVMLCCWVLTGRLADCTRWRAVRGLLIAGTVARLLLVAVAPFTTHDVMRYLWDGAVVLSGVDPYLHTPSSPELAELREQCPVAPEQRQWQTLYPPLALAAFALAASAGRPHAIWAWKGIAALGSVALLWAGAALLRRMGQERHLPVLALSPTLVLEAGVGAHVDVLAAAALGVGLLAFAHQRWRTTGAALGVGGLLKLSPALILLPLAAGLLARVATAAHASVRPRQALHAVRRMAVAAGLTVAAGYGTILALGWWPWGSTGAFFARWRFGSPLGEALAQLSQQTGASFWPQLSLAAIMMALVMIAALRDGRAEAPYRCAAWLLAGILVISPVVFPWYLMVLWPALAVAPSATLVIWASTAPLTYEVIDLFDQPEAIWAPASWPLWVIVAGWIAGAAIDTRPLRARLRSARAPAGPQRAQRTPQDP